MNIKKFNENNEVDVPSVEVPSAKDRVFIIHKHKPIYKRTIDHYKSIGCTLYYYSNFELLEVKRTRMGALKWENKWGEMIFFLTQEEYDSAMVAFNKSKELYEKQLKAAKLIKDMPMSHLYHNILKMGK